MRRCWNQKQLPESAMSYVLESVVPYTDANLKLSFHPHLFFNDLENIAARKQREKKRRPYQRATLRQAYYRAKRDKLIGIGEDGRPFLTAAGQRQLHPYQPAKLGENAYLMVTFDIPERHRHLRDHLRQLLKNLGFEQVQKSVWKTEYDYREVLQNEIRLHRLHSYVYVYEAVKLN